MLLLEIKEQDLLGTVLTNLIDGEKYNGKEFMTHPDPFI